MCNKAIFSPICDLRAFPKSPQNRLHLKGIHTLPASQTLLLLATPEMSDVYYGHLWSPIESQSLRCQGYIYFRALTQCMGSPNLPKTGPRQIPSEKDTNTSGESDAFVAGHARDEDHCHPWTPSESRSQRCRRRLR